MLLYFVPSILNQSTKSYMLKCNIFVILIQDSAILSLIQIRLVHHLLTRIMHPTTPFCTSGELPRGDRRRNRCETTLDAARSGLIGLSAARREAHGHAVYGPDGMRAACDAAEQGCAHPRDMLDHTRSDLDQARKSKAGRKSLDALVYFACRLILRRPNDSNGSHKVPPAPFPAHRIHARCVRECGSSQHV